MDAVLSLCIGLLGAAAAALLFVAIVNWMEEKL